MTDRKKTAQEIADEIADAMDYDRRMHTKYILNPDHSIVSCDLMTWAVWYEESANRRVALTVTEDYEISTVFVGVDHNWSGVGPPILFETMTFSRHGDEDERDQVRYATWDQAIAGHAAMVRKAVAISKLKGVEQMGMFGKLLGGKAKDAMNQFSGNKDFLEGLCAACAWTAAAEGGIDDEEFDKSVEVLMSKEAISSGFKQGEVEQVFARMTKKTGSRSGKAELAEEIRQVVENDKSGAMGNAIMLAALDVADTGGISAEEEVVMRKIADICKVNYDKLVA